MSDRSDPELMSASARGDDEAFTELVQRHQRLVYQFLYRFHGGPQRHIVEDLSQEVFLRAWRAAGTFRPQAKVTTWLLQIALNLSLNYRRGWRLRQTAHLDGTSPAAAEEPLSDTVEQVRAALATLPESQRAALVLAVYHEHSYAEIAEILETTKSAVESLLFRARENLRKRLQRWQDESRQDEPPPAA